jgi:hypothetical protein
MDFIEICIGISMNQFFPEYIKIPVEIEDEGLYCPMCTISTDEQEKEH